MQARSDSTSGARVLAAEEGSAIDRELLDRFCAGDEHGFERLMARHRSLVVNFLFRLTGDRGLAEDLGQETFVRVYQKARDFTGSSASGSGSSTARSWILAIARNLAIDHSRVKFRLFGRRGRAATLELVGEPVDAGPAPPLAAQRAELQCQVTAAIAALAEPYRSAVALVDISGLPYHEAAAALGCSAKTLSSRVTRARRQLRATIDPTLLESMS